MKSGKELKTLIPAALGLTVLILDGSTSIEGARAGLEICLRTVLPSLFPFIFLSSLLTTSLLSGNYRGNRILCRLYRIPQGADGILITGLLGGYPVGAKCIGEAVTEGRLSPADGERMLVYCNAAGPAFLFGITGTVFPERWIPWCLWGIHLFSGICVARLLPSSSGRHVTKASMSNLSIPQRLRQSLLVMGDICGWIILMRTVIAVAQRWCLWHLPEPLQLMIVGIVELSNGCIALSEIGNTGLRFLLCSVFLGFGGLCVALQTGSAASSVSQRLYLPGKVIQALISFVTAYTVQYFTFKSEEQAHLTWVFFSALLILSVIFVYSRAKPKNNCGILENVGV